MAFLNGFEKAPSLRDKLTSLVIDERRMSIHLLTMNVGQGFKEHNFYGDTLMNVRTSLSETN